MFADLVGQKETLAAFHLMSPWYLHERSQVPAELSHVFEWVPYLGWGTGSEPAPRKQLLRLVVLQKRICVLLLSLSPHGEQST